jgi:small subunit ribosomal protein S9
MAEYYYGTGRRKNAIAKVWLKEGTGQIKVNGRTMHEYLSRPTLEMHAAAPLVVTNMSERFDVMVKCLGGGNSGQAGAMRHGLARALVQYDEALRKTLRAHGMLTRDPRVKERKKYGRKRARRGFQFSKR